MARIGSADRLRGPPPRRTGKGREWIRVACARCARSLSPRCSRPPPRSAPPWRRRTAPPTASGVLTALGPEMQGACSLPFQACRSASAGVYTRTRSAVPRVRSSRGPGQARPSGAPRGRSAVECLQTVAGEARGQYEWKRPRATRSTAPSRSPPRSSRSTARAQPRPAERAQTRRRARSRAGRALTAARIPRTRAGSPQRLRAVRVLMRAPGHPRDGPRLCRAALRRPRAPRPPPARAAAVGVAPDVGRDHGAVQHLRARPPSSCPVPARADVRQRRHREPRRRGLQRESAPTLGPLVRRLRGSGRPGGAELPAVLVRADPGRRQRHRGPGPRGHRGSARTTSSTARSTRTCAARSRWSSK